MRGAGLAVLLAVALAAPAAATERIVSVDGAVTEIIHALGQGHRLVGVDSGSRWPAAADALPDVGYKRALSAEGVLSLAPTLLLGTEAAGPPAALDQLRAAGLAMALVTDDPTLEGVAAKVTGVAEALGLAAAGAALNRRIAADLEAALAAVPDGPRPRVLFLVETGRGGLMAAGGDTAAHAIVQLAGGENAVPQLSSLKPLTAEAAVAARPDVVLVAKPDPGAGAADYLIRTELAATPAARNGRIVALDSLLVLGFGPRIGEAVRTVALAIHGGEAPGRQVGAVPPPAVNP